MALLLPAACTEQGSALGPGGPDTGFTFDATVPGDGGRFDAGSLDAGRLDSGHRDSGPPDAGPEACNPGEVIRCACPPSSSGQQFCRSDGTLGCCWCPNQSESDRLMCLRQAMVGTWRGVITTPWQPSYTANVEFRADGTYASQCDTPDCTTFYYGEDGAQGGREYELFDVRPNGNGVGRLSVVFGGGNAQWGDLDNVEVSEREDRLEFNFWNTWSNRRLGPINAVFGRIPR